MHGIEPTGYLRDLFCLLPSWPARRVLDLAPVNWVNLEQSDTQQRLDANVFRRVHLGQSVAHPAKKQLLALRGSRRDSPNGYDNRSRLES